MRLLYIILLVLLLPVFLAVAAVRAKRQTGSADSTRDRLGFASPAPPGKVLWVHASSVGEMQAAVPLVKALSAGYPDAHLVVSSFTASGMSRARAAFGETVQVCALPFDLPSFNRRFISRIRPHALIVMETEIWPNLYAEIAARGVPVLLVSARMTERSLRNYRRLGELVTRAMRQVSYVGAQTVADGERFCELGVARNAIRTVGNLKFDIPESAEVREQGQAMRSLLFGAAPVLVAASTRVGEDEIVLDAFARLREAHADARLVIVPRHPERGGAVAGMARDAGFRVALRTADSVPGGIDVYVIDTIGELNAFYAASDACFVGGSLVPAGGHNLLEPASLGIATVTGPLHSAAPDIFEDMRDSRAIIVVRDAGGLARAWRELLDDPVRRDELGQAARATVERNRGTLETVMGDVGKFLGGSDG
ncbi:MAG TPA: 3-deoxy-D-manno-octulosonic acid transferase [Gammaproteobacteria bacterium]